MSPGCGPTARLVPWWSPGAPRQAGPALRADAQPPLASSGGGRLPRRLSRLRSGGGTAQLGGMLTS